MFFLSVLEWHGILLACWSVVNSNVNGLAGSLFSEEWEEGREGTKEFGDYEEERYGYESGFEAAAVPPSQRQEFALSYLFSLLSSAGYSIPSSFLSFLDLLFFHPSAFCLTRFWVVNE